MLFFDVIVNNFFQIVLFAHLICFKSVRVILCSILTYIQLFLRALSNWCEVDETSPSIGGEAEAALAAVAEEVVSLCYQFAEKMAAENSDGLAELLEIALSEGLRKCCFFLAFFIRFFSVIASCGAIWSLFYSVS